MGGGPFVPLRAKKMYFFLFPPTKKCRDVDQFRWGTLSRNFVRCPLVFLPKPSDFNSTPKYSAHDLAISKLRILMQTFLRHQRRSVEDNHDSEPYCASVDCQVITKVRLRYALTVSSERRYGMVAVSV